MSSDSASYYLLLDVNSLQNVFVYDLSSALCVYIKIHCETAKGYTILQKHSSGGDAIVLQPKVFALRESESSREAVSQLHSGFICYDILCVILHNVNTLHIPYMQ